jgi:uncharacterized metal-binding protein
MCTVGIEGNVSDIIKSTEGTDEIVAIDGCPFSVQRSLWSLQGSQKNKNIVITELGIKKEEVWTWKKMMSKR